MSFEVVVSAAEVFPGHKTREVLHHTAMVLQHLQHVRAGSKPVTPGPAAVRLRPKAHRMVLVPGGQRAWDQEVLPQRPTGNSGQSSEKNKQVSSMSKECVGAGWDLYRRPEDLVRNVI